MMKQDLHRVRKLPGFSLLEVMVAFSLLALSFTTLFLVQGRVTRMAIEARNISVATSLARVQLAECSREVKKIVASASDFKLEGDFLEQGFDGFSFECHAPKFNMKTPSTSDLEKGIKSRGGKNEQAKSGQTSSVAAPFISMITNSLSDSVRELSVIIRWQDGDVEDELRVTTHVIDHNAMAILSRTLSQGAKSFGQNFSKKTPSAPQVGGNR